MAPKVSIIIPTRNEEKSIGHVINAIPSQVRKASEIIVIDTKSTDRTVGIARSLGAKVIDEERPGYGRAYITGFGIARGETIVMIDGDNTYPAERLKELLKIFETEKADMLIASRFRGKILPGAMPCLNYLGNLFFTFLTNVFYGISISDSNSGYRILSREALEKMVLKCEGMEFASELNVQAARLGLKIVEVPIEYGPRKGEKAKLKALPDGWKHLKFLVGDRFFSSAR